MVLLKEIYRRAFEGPIITQKEFLIDTYLPRLEELAKEYDIVDDKEELMPTDPGIADSIYEAGMELFLERGLWYQPTRRAIKFTPEEVKKGLRDVPCEMSFGEGKDEVTIRSRKTGDKNPPIQAGGPHGMGCTSPEIFMLIHQSYAQEPMDILNDGTQINFNGKRIKMGSPAEVMAAAQGARLLREAVRRAERPDMAINFDSQAMSDVAHTAIACPGGARPTDIWTVLPTIPNSTILKMNFNKAAFTCLNGVPYHSSSSSVLYGYSGDTVTTAIATVADAIGMALFDGCWSLACTGRDTKGIINSRGVLWVENMSTLALTRNTKIMTRQMERSMAGPCTKQCLYEIAVVGILRDVSGTAWTTGVIPNYGAINDHGTGLEGRFNHEVREAVAGISSLSDANELARPIFDKFKDKLENAPRGKSFQECYDLDTVTPSDEYLKLYAEVKSELEDMGIPFK